MRSKNARGATAMTVKEEPRGMSVKKRKKNTWKLMVEGIKSGTIPFSDQMNSLARRVCLFVVVMLGVGVLAPIVRGAQEGGIRVLLLGDNGHHRPAEFFK